MEKKNNAKKYLIIGWVIGLVLGLLIGGTIGFFDGHIQRGNFSPRGNFQIDDATKAQITSFFDSTSDMNQINNYCQQNRMYCSYYCRTINPGNELCKSLFNSTNYGGWHQ